MWKCWLGFHGKWKVKGVKLIPRAVGYNLSPHTLQYYQHVREQLQDRTSILLVCESCGVVKNTVVLGNFVDDLGGLLDGAAVDKFLRTI